MFIKTTTLLAAIAAAHNNMPVSDVIDPKGQAIWSVGLTVDQLSKTRSVSEVRLMPDNTFRVCLSEYALSSDKLIFSSKSKPEEFLEHVEDAIDMAFKTAHEYLKIEANANDSIAVQLSNAQRFECLTADAAAHIHYVNHITGNGAYL